MVSAKSRVPGTSTGCFLAALVLLAAQPRAGAQGVDEIVVTARKRAESLQEVPLSVSAFTAEQIRERGIADNYDLAAFTVNFSTQQQLGRRDDRPVFRGMTAPATRGEPNASYFIDGVFVSGSVSTATLGAVERIEVLRGPQSAQFGRATFSGAVNYVTRRPGNAHAAEFTARAGSHDNQQLGGWLSGPLLKDRLLYFIAANYEKRGGEWRNDLPADAAEVGLLIDPPQQADRSSLGGTETTEFTGKLVLLPTELTEISLKYSYSRGDDEHFAPLPWTELNCFLPTDPSQPWWDKSAEGTPRGGAWCGELDPEGLQARVNLPDFRTGVAAVDILGAGGTLVAPPATPGTRRTQHRLLLEYQQAWGDWDLVLRGAYNDDDLEQVLDLDRLEGRAGPNLTSGSAGGFPALIGLFHIQTLDDRRDYSFEARINSPTAGRRLRGQLGVYFYDFEGRARQRSFPGPGAQSLSPPRVTETVNSAVFGSLEYDFGERLTLAAEARYAEDQKEIRGANGISADAIFTSFTPRVTLRYQATDDLMAYGLAARGTKPGDFNVGYFSSLTPGSVADILPQPPIDSASDPRCSDGTPLGTFDALACGRAIIDEEEAWTYELGAKTAWFRRRLIANLALFYIDWENQGQFQTVPILRDPALSGTTEQLDTVVVNAGLSRSRGAELELTLRVTDSLLVNFGYGYTDAEYREFFSDFNRSVTGNGDVSGNRLPNHAEHSTTLGIAVSRPIGDSLEVFLRPDLVYETERWADETNLPYLGTRSLVNIRFGLRADRWVATAFVTNLLDDDTPTAASSFVNFVAPRLPNGANGNIWTLNPSRGRNWGLELLYRF